MKNASHYFFEKFFAQLADRDLSPSTVSGYRIDLADFVRWFEGTNRVPFKPGDVANLDLREYQSYMQNVRRLKPGTINRRMTNLYCFMKWAQGEGFTTRTLVFPRKVRVQPLPPKALERNEQNRLLREVERRGKLRDIALVRLLISCGLRASETVALQVSDLALGERHGKIIIRRGKGNKYREAPAPPETRKALREWLAEREKRCSKGNPYLFPNRQGGHITVRCLQQMIKNLGYFGGLDLHPHTLRHTAATNMLRSGADLVTVAQVLGHASVNTTAIYTKPDGKTMMEAAERGEM